MVKVRVLLGISSYLDGVFEKVLIIKDFGVRISSLIRTAPVFDGVTPFGVYGTPFADNSGFHLCG